MIPLPKSWKAGIASFLNDISTTRDGVSFDVIRVGLIVSIFAFIVYTAWDVIVNRHWDPMQYGLGTAGMFSGAGIGIGAKAKDEPSAD